MGFKSRKSLVLGTGHSYCICHLVCQINADFLSVSNFQQYFLGLDLGILVKLTLFLIIIILCLIFAKLYPKDVTFWILLFVKYFYEFFQWHGIFWVVQKYPILLIPICMYIIYQGRSQH